jgi:hypothetical protein
MTSGDQSENASVDTVFMYNGKAMLQLSPQVISLNI